MWFFEVKTNESNTVADQIRSHRYKILTAGCPPSYSTCTSTLHTLPCCTSFACILFSFVFFSAFRWAVVVVLVVAASAVDAFSSPLFGSFSVWIYDDQKSKTAFKRTGNVHAQHIKTMRTQWQLSAPPLNHMTSCTYIYFTAITFYRYYRCSTFIFISHLFIYFLLVRCRCCEKKLCIFIDIGAAFCSFNLHRSLHICGIV